MQHHSVSNLWVGSGWRVNELANLFLGFPVPRAKIAEMIEGSAPPKAHRDWHKPNGSDPLSDPTDITPGQALGWDGTKYKGYDVAAAGGLDLSKTLLLLTAFESLDGWYQDVDGGALVTLEYHQVTLTTNSKANARAGIYENLEYPYGPLTWSKNRRFKLRAYVKVDDESNPVVRIHTGSGVSGNRGFGITFEPTKIRGFCTNQTGIAYADLVTGLTAPYVREEIYEAIFTAATKVDFYIDGVLKGTINTKIPTGTTDSKGIIGLDVESIDAVEHQIITSQILFMQDL